MKELPITRETYWKVQSVDPSGRAWCLYTFYANLAVRKESSQPLATDKFCQNGLKWGSVNTVAKARLALVEAGAIKIKRKFGYRYVQVNFLTVTLQNKRFDLSTVPIPPGIMGTALVFDYYAEWWERLTTACLDEFSIRLKKEMQVKDKPDFDTMYNYLNVVYNRIQTNAKCITTMDTELRFWGHLLHSVAEEFKKDESRMKVA